MTELYAQANEHGYVVSVTNESLLAGLFGGECKKIDQKTADAIRVIKDKGLPVHLDQIESVQKMLADINSIRN